MHDLRTVWRDGEMVPFADATCHVLSHMAARGSQVFDVMLVTRTALGPSAVGLRQHVTRFLRSAELMGMQDVGATADLERAIAKTVLANTGSNIEPGTGLSGYDGPMTVKIVAAWSEESLGVLPASLRPTVYVLAFPSSLDLTAGVMREPAKVRSASMPKIPAEILPPSLKVAASYTPGLREQLASKAKGFDHTVFKTLGGDVAESTTLSMLLVTGGRIVAPPLDSVLDGITRRVLLDVAQHAGIPVDVRASRWEEVTEADELLLASTSEPIVPIALLDDQSFEAPGPITVQLAEGMGGVYDGTHELSSKWLTDLSGLV